MNALIWSRLSYRRSLRSMRSSVWDPLWPDLLLVLLSRWLFRRICLRPSWRPYRRRTLRFAGCIIHLGQAASSPTASSLLKLLCHRFGSEPPTTSEGDAFLPTNVNIYFILGSLVTFSLDRVFVFLEPSSSKALSHRCIHAYVTPLLQLNGDLLSGGVPGFGLRDSVVICSFSKDQYVRSLL